MRISDWSSDVCSSVLRDRRRDQPDQRIEQGREQDIAAHRSEIVPAFAQRPAQVGGVDAADARLRRRAVGGRLGSRRPWCIPRSPVPPPPMILHLFSARPPRHAHPAHPTLDITPPITTTAAPPPTNTPNHTLTT